MGKDDLTILHSDVIPSDGILHGFPERTGGVSEGLRSSLNLGARWGDERENVEENRRRVARVAGFDVEKLQMTRHVHGTSVWVVGDPLPDDGEFDGLVTNEPGFTLAAFAADCIPILFADPVSRTVGAAHSGWRGTVAGVAANVVATMKARFNVNPQNLHVALGPSIGPCCFEVGPEVVAKFHQKFGPLPGMVIQGPQKPHIDLRFATRIVLETAGVPPDQIDDAPPCTKCNPDRFFSYRRDGRDGGVHMGYVGLAGR